MIVLSWSNKLATSSTKPTWCSQTPPRPTSLTEEAASRREAMPVILIILLDKRIYTISVSSSQGFKSSAQERIQSDRHTSHKMPSSSLMSYLRPEVTQSWLPLSSSRLRRADVSKPRLIRNSWNKSSRRMQLREAWVQALILKNCRQKTWLSGLILSICKRLSTTMISRVWQTASASLSKVVHASVSFTSLS